MNLSFIIYNITFLLALLFASFSKIKSNKIFSPGLPILKKYGFFLSAGIIILVSGTRNKVGTDYESYTDIFFQIKDGLPVLIEIGYFFLNKVFINFENGYRFVFFLTSGITYYLFFKLLRRENILFLGIIFLFTFGFVFFANNAIRQALVIPIFYLSIKYIEQRAPVKYFSAIAFAALFHFSALFLIPIYWIYKINFNKNIWVLLLLISLIISFTSATNLFISNILKLIPRFSGYAQHDITSSLSSGATAILYIFIYLVILCYYRYFQKNERERIYLNILLIGFNIAFILMPVSFLYRIAYYFLFLLVIIIPILIKNITDRNNKIILTYFFILFSLIFWAKALLLNDHGCIPYQTFIF